MDSSRGSFTVHRFVIQTGITYKPDYTRSFTLAFGYGYDDYDFDGDKGFIGLRPWDDIHTFRLSAPIRITKGMSWSFFVVPTIKISGEKGADFNDSLTGGGFAGLAYRFNERLSMGPGIGVMTQIEDDTSIFPMLVINWKITDTLSLETGGGSDAGLGPGISLNWLITDKYLFTLGGRYKKLRFRLDNNSEIKNGVGQDKSFPIFIGITYKFNSSARLSLTGGIDIKGELKLEDKDGKVIEQEDYETAPFLGLSFSYRF